MFLAYRALSFFSSNINQTESEVSFPKTIWIHLTGFNVDAFLWRFYVDSDAAVLFS